nr:redoxin domain-containing protein [uncultured Marinifilum sp.]
MKSFNFILFALLAIISSCTTQVDNKYHITGTGWDKYNGNEFRIAVQDTSDLGLKVLAKAQIIEGNFILAGEIEHPQSAYLGIYTSDGEFAGWKQNYIAESGELLMELKTDAKKATILGGNYNDIIFRDIAENAEINSAKKELDEFSKKFYGLKKEEQDQLAKDKFMKLYKKHTDLLKVAYTKLFENHEDPYVRLLCISHLRGMENIKEELASLEKEIGTVPEISMYRYSMKKAEEAAKNRKTVGVGSIVQDFTAKNLEGESFNLANVLKENKYVLVEFWASWCSPCRAEIPHMKKAYSHFKDKEFEIVSFTLDHVQKSWKKASDKEQIPWINVGDLKAHASPVVQMYGVQGVPANFLVNAKGEIVAVNLRGTQLDEKLEELLK